MDYDQIFDPSTIDAFIRVNNSDKEPLGVLGLRVIVAQNRAQLLNIQRAICLEEGIPEAPSIDAINMAMTVAFHLDREFTTAAQKAREK